MIILVSTGHTTEKRKWDGTAYEPDPLVWTRLERQVPQQVCRKTLASYSAEKGFLLPFLNQTFQILPGKRTIVPLCSHAPMVRSFELDLIILSYLLGAQALDLTGRMVNEKQLPNGETFFRGPHRLSTGPMEKVFGNDRTGFVSAGKKLNGTVRKLGDAAICLPVFPRVPVTLILWEKDDEFPAKIMVNFDSTVSSHLPLDVIWAVVNVASQWMTRSAYPISSLSSGSN